MRDDGPWLRAAWPAPANIVAFTTLRGDASSGASRAPFDHFNLGARCGDDPLAVAINRTRLIERAALPQAPRWLNQVHGLGVVRFDGAEMHTEREADAAVTSEPGVVLSILTADCLPVLFCAGDGCEIAAAHAGWRGLAHGVLERTVAAMHSAPEEVLAWLGPAAGPSAYEIGVEVRDAFVERDRGAEAAFVPTRPGHWRVDLYALARRRLAAVGVQRVFGGDRCTISDPRRFYSHRRDGRSGRMASLIWIGRDARPEPV
jgi:YfiH family protein